MIIGEGEVPKGRVVEATVSEVKDGEEKPKNTAIMIPLKRHPLMEGIEKKYVQELQEEADLDRALGLNNQLHMDELDMVRHDIDELTSSREFVEVNELDLQKIFEWSKIQIKCSIQNVLTVVKTFRVPAIFALLGVVLFVLANSYKPLHTILVVIGSLSMAGMVVSVIVLCASGVNFIMLMARWDREDIKRTSVRLPKAAKLKIKEAMDSQVFIKFDIIHPVIIEKNTRVGFPEYNADPGVVGVTADNRQFLIVCWDVENDSVKTNPKRLKALKLKQKMSSRRTFNGIGDRF